MFEVGISHFYLKITFAYSEAISPDYALSIVQRTKLRTLYLSSHEKSKHDYVIICMNIDEV